MTTTVADLRKHLATLPDDMPVVLAEDSEGNAFSPLAAATTAFYDAENAFSGEWYATPRQREMADDPEDYPAPPSSAVPALFLWPTA